MLPASDRTTFVEYREIARIPGFRFGSDARVETRWMRGVKKQLGTEWRPLRPTSRPNGHRWFYVGPEKTTKPLRLDMVICEAFHGERPPGTECLHRDDNNANCEASNLYWGVPFDKARDPSVEYRTLPETDGYEFGFDGSIWTFWATGFTEKRDVCRRLKGTVLDSGHIQVVVKWNGEERRFGAHHLICLAFHGRCPNGMEVCHNDGNPSNNRADNLRWDTYAANMEDRRRHGVMVCGVRQWQAKLDDDKVRDIRKTYDCGRATQVQLAELYGVSDNTISRIIRRVTWKHVT